MSYYVTAKRPGSDAAAFLAGPWRRHGDALRAVGHASLKAHWADPRNGFDMTYGTARHLTRHDRVGALNESMGLTLDADGFVMVREAPRVVIDFRTVLHGSGPAPRGYVICHGARPGCYSDDDRHFHAIRHLS